MVANVAYDALHTSVMIGIFHRYGLNPWIYIVYVIGFSVGFAWSSLALVGALVDRQHRRAWLVSAMTAVCFFAPEFFLITTTQHVPAYIYVLFGAYLAGSSTLAVLTLARRYRANRIRAGNSGAG
jgi:MFS family permease